MINHFPTSVNQFNLNILQSSLLYQISINLIKEQILLQGNCLLLQFKEVMEGIETQINQFFDRWEYYCYPDKTEKCRPQVDQFLKQIDKLQEDTSENKKKEKAKLLYLRGKILDLLPAYQKLAEQYLNKSIKLNPTNGDCWNTLAHVLFKKGDLQGSQKAVQMAIDNKGKNKVSLRYQSVLLRCQGKNEEERRKNIQESLKIIKGAILLDLKDPATWYFLGNAYFSNFVANFKKFDQLENAIKAYNQAEKYFQCKYPDLFINRGNVEWHMENYQSAIKDFKQAHQIDKTAGCLQNVNKIKGRMQFTKQAIERVGQLKKTKIQQLIKNIPNSLNNNKQLQVATIKKLKPRYNAKKLLTGKIVTRITNTNDIPFSYLALDYQGNHFCLSLYNVNSVKIDEKLKKDSLISIVHPQVKQITFEGLNYISVQLFEPTKLRIDDGWLSKQEFNPTEIRSQAFEK